MATEGSSSGKKKSVPTGHRDEPYKPDDPVVHEEKSDKKWIVKHSTDYKSWFLSSHETERTQTRPFDYEIVEKVDHDSAFPQTLSMFASDPDYYACGPEIDEDGNEEEGFDEDNCENIVTQFDVFRYDPEIQKHQRFEGTADLRFIYIHDGYGANEILIYGFATEFEHNDYSGRGIGRMIMSILRRVANDNNIPDITLHDVWADAKGFWDKMNDENLISAVGRL